MTDNRCPECGHELAGRGRFCIFCGSDLRKPSRIIGSAQSHSSDGLWNPEKAYGKSASHGTAVLLLAVLCIAIALVSVFAINAIRGSNYSALSEKQPVLHSGMSFTEASAEMERCGFNKVSSSGNSSEGNKFSCNFHEHTSYSETARIITLVVEEGKDGYVAVSYYYMDRESSFDESLLFRRLKKELCSRYGDPEYGSYIIDCYRWPISDGYVMLSSTASLVTVFEMHGN